MITSIFRSGIDRQSYTGNLNPMLRPYHLKCVRLCLSRLRQWLGNRRN
jgi:hypothetical protein